MPTWAYNRLAATGSAAALARFADAVRFDVPFAFERILPTPPETDDPRAWRVAHWDTKWDACYCSVSGSAAGGLLYEFQSAWSPPVPVIREASRQHPPVTLVHEYAGEFADYAGRTTWLAGSAIAHEDLDPIEIGWVEWVRSADVGV
jgi:hypothetical protein